MFRAQDSGSVEDGVEWFKPHSHTTESIVHLRVYEAVIGKAFSAWTLRRGHEISNEP
jgi:hypothetical protein